MDVKSYLRALEICQSLSGVLDCGFCLQAGGCALHRLEQDVPIADHQNRPILLPRSVSPPGDGKRTRRRSEPGICDHCEELIPSSRYRFTITLTRPGRGKDAGTNGTVVCVPCHLAGILDSSFIIERESLSMLLAAERDDRFRALWCIPGGKSKRS